MTLGELLLERFVFPGGLGAGAQVVAESEVPLDLRRASLERVDLMRALAAMPELERGQIDVFHCRRQGAATLAGLGTQLADENARCWVFAETPSGEPHGPQGGASD